ncbi:hypothetical protein U8Q05_26740 (plasmid) [Rhizobium ruizarguesonis]|nr:hypothetical protein U8Q05_26740 [Rhizobium ruizarguesonis]
MDTRFKWLVDFGLALGCAFALIGIAGTVALLSMAQPVKWCSTDGCSIQGWVGVISSSLATVFALVTVVVAMQALRVQRKGSEAQLRAYMIIERAEFDMSSDSVDIAFKNCGATPALDFEIVIDLDMVTDRDAILPVPLTNMFKFGVIGPDKFQTLDWIKVTSTRRVYLLDLHAGTKHICFGGWIDYSDIFGARHRLTVHMALTSDGTTFRKKLDIIRQTYEKPPSFR